MENQRHIKVLHVVSTLNLGGAERFTIDLSQLQKSQNVFPVILNLGDSSDQLSHLAVRLGIRTIVCGSRFGRVGRFWNILSNVKVEDPDAIHIHSPSALKYLFPIIPLLSIRRKIIYTRHGNGPLLTFKWKTLHKLIRPFVDWITFVSDEGQVVYHANHYWPKDKSIVIENGVNLSQINATMKQRSNTIKIGSVGRMDKIKGQIYLLKAVEKLQEHGVNNLEIHFYGAGPEETRLKKFVNEKLSTVNIYFHGFIEARSEIYEKVDLLVVCSENEGLSLAIMESMAYGIPVVATNVGGNPRLVKDSINGALYNYADINELSEILVGIQNNPNILEEWGAEAKKFIIENFSLESTHKRYYHCYVN